MKLLKVRNGLLEVDNFYLTSSFFDFTGSSQVTRDINLGTVSLITNTKIERYFPYQEFVIEIKKQNWNQYQINENCKCYLGTDTGDLYGIKDDIQGEHSYWKLIGQDGYIQAYCSSDGVTYANIGGLALPGNITCQGFEKLSTENFILDSYKVYASPYVTIQNFPENTLCELYAADGTLLKSRLFNANQECKVFLDSSMQQGYFMFKDSLGALLYTSDPLPLGYGDVYIISPYNFEIIYLGNTVTNVNPALLQDLDEVISIKNVGSQNYVGITIGTQTSGNDLIELSLDGINYSSTISLDLSIDESKNIYVKITKSIDNHNFSVRDFQLIIEE